MSSNVEETVIEHVRCLRFQPGDRLVVTFPERLPTEAFERARMTLQKFAGADIPVLLMDGGAELSILRQES